MRRKKVLRRRASEHLSVDIRGVTDCISWLEKVEQWTFHSTHVHKTKEGAIWGQKNKAFGLGNIRFVTHIRHPFSDVVLAAE